MIQYKVKSLSRMRKFYVLYCLKNMHRPTIYLSKKSATDKMNYNSNLDVKTFKRQIEAQKFLFPKKISYLLLKQQLQNKGVDIQTMQNVKKKTKQNQQLLTMQEQQNLMRQNYPRITRTTNPKLTPQTQPQPMPQQSQQVSPEINMGEQQKKQSHINQNRDETHKQKSMIQRESEVEQKKTEESQIKVFAPPQNNINKDPLVEKPSKTSKSKSTKTEPAVLQAAEQKVRHTQNLDIEGEESILDINELQRQMKQVALTSIMKINLMRTYKEILCYQGSENRFIKTFVSIGVKSNQKYFGFFDGCSKGNPGLSGCGYTLLSGGSGALFEKSLNLGVRTNNQSQFLALIYLLLDCKHNGIQKIKVFGDSELVVNSLNQQKKIHDKKLKYLYIIAKYLSKTFIEFQIVHVYRQNNTRADKLANQGIKKKCLTSRKFQYLNESNSTKN